MHVSVNEIEKIFAKIIQKLRDEHVEALFMKDDYYRRIPADRWADPVGEPFIFTCSLHDDIHCLKLLLDPSQNRPCMYVDFDRMASLLHAISQEINPP